MASLYLSSSTPVDNDDRNDVDMNTSTVPNLVKPNAESNALINVYQGLSQGGGGEKGGGT